MERALEGIDLAADRSMAPRVIATADPRLAKALLRAGYVKVSEGVYERTEG